MRVKIGVIGCGTVSHIYLSNIMQFPDLEVIACGDLDEGRARAVADKYGVTASGGPSTVFEDKDVEVVVNLTTPASHAEISHAAITAGKHVYSEKPLALDLAQGRELVQAAELAGVRIAVAPDTFLGAGLQAGLRLITQGLIGEPLSALTMMQGPGPELWHPNPAFVYQPGAGPLFDLGPYNLTVMGLIFGPVSRVAATARRARDMRLVAAGPLAGMSFPVDVSTHYHGLFDFRGGQAATATFSFDSPLHRFDFLEITGTDATIALPNPNMYEGPSMIRRAGDQEWTVVANPVAVGKRGVGVLEFARAIRCDRPHQATAQNALHLLEVMRAADESAETAKFIDVRSDFTIPPPLGDEWAPHELTLE